MQFWQLGYRHSDQRNSVNSLEQFDAIVGLTIRQKLEVKLV
jgi:hypothetical protein